MEAQENNYLTSISIDLFIFGHYVTGHLSMSEDEKDSKHKCDCPRQTWSMATLLMSFIVIEDTVMKNRSIYVLCTTF